MRALLDISVLLALLDAQHVHHDATFGWVEAGGLREGWASCPITENGVVRILSQPTYPHPVTPAEAVAALSGSTADGDHEFWASDVSITDENLVRPDRLHGHRQVTDAYLLALAVAHRGVFVTLDRRVTTAAVPGATAGSLVVL